MRTVFTIFLILLTLKTQAQEIHAAAGVRSDIADSETRGVDTEGKASFQGGVIAYMDLSESLRTRMGLLISQRRYDVDQGSTILAEPRLSYLDIPVGALYNFNEFGGAFAGVNIGLNVTKSCGAGSCTGVNSLPLAGQVGGVLNLMDRMGLELYYEQGITKIADEIENARVLVGQLTYAF